MRVIMMAVASVLAIVGGCRDASGVAGGTVESASLALAVDLTESVDIAQVRLIVQAADLAEPLLFSLAIQAGEARGTAFVPVGPQRLFTLQALDDVGTLRYEGAATVDVTAGANPPLTIVMAATGESGDVPIVGTLGGFTVEITPEGATIEIDSQIRFYPVVRDPWGNVASGATVSWLSRDSLVAVIDEQGTAHGRSAGTATVVATYGLAVDSVSLRVLQSPLAEPPRPSLDEPVYDPLNPAHVSHLYEDWSTYATVAEIERTRRVDGGLPWLVANTSALSFAEPGDPYGGAKTLTISYPAAGETTRGLRATFFDVERPPDEHFRNVTGEEEVIVLEWAARFSGTNAYLGKTMDLHNGSLGRWNYDPGPGGIGSLSNCDEDALCSLYYDDNGQTPRFPGLMPSPKTWSPKIYRIDNTVTEPFTSVVQYKQNMNWGTGPGQFVWGTNAERMNDNVWRRFKLRYTTNPAGAPNGYGRIEMWVDGIQIMNYRGDAGALEEGMVFVTGPILVRGGTTLDVYRLSAHIHEGAANVHLGYIRVWSHPRLE